MEESLALPEAGGTGGDWWEEEAPTAAPAPACAEDQRLRNQLQREASSFNFFKAVHLLEADCSGAEGSGGGKGAVGFQGPVEQERIRFRGNPSLGFPAADIARATVNGLGQVELEANFAGLYGPASPLPVHFTEAVIAEQARIEREDVNDYFIAFEHQIRALRDHRLNLTPLLQEAAAIKKQLRAGTLQARPLSDEEVDRLRAGEPLSALLEAAELQAFREERLVLHLYERPSSRQRDFLDLFNHRLISLFYRCWKKYRPAFQYRSGAEDDFSQWLFALMGAPDARARAESAICWPRLLGYLGLLSMQARSAGVLKAVISGYFDGIPVTIEEHLPRWAGIPHHQRTRLGISCSRLGESISLGSRIRDHSGKFRVSLGPLGLDQFNRLLPGGADHAALRELVTFLMPEQLLFDIELQIERRATPPMQLAKSGEGCRLGWSTWLGEPAGTVQRVAFGGG